MILGLTGDIACGKSTVARILTDFGAVVIDADLLVRELYANKQFAAFVEASFEPSVLDEEGKVDRAKLAPIVFADRAALQRLEELVHPAVAALRDRKIKEIQTTLKPPAIVVEAVKLIESKQSSKCDVVWCVICSPEVQLQRLMETRGLTESAARARLAHQPSFAAKLPLLGEIPLVLIENNGSLDVMERQVQSEWEKLVDPGMECKKSQ